VYIWKVGISRAREFVSSCDDVLSLVFGFDLREDASCPRAVFKAVKK